MNNRLMNNENAPLWILLIFVVFELIDSFRMMIEMGTITNVDIIFNSALMIVLVIDIAAIGRGMRYG